jgi:NitT/TauT family transport system permease protein
MTFRTRPSTSVYAALATAGILGLLAVWAALSAIEWLPPAYSPGPEAVAKAGLELILKRGLVVDVAASGGRILVAFVASAVLAVPLGLAMSCWKPIEALVEPIIDFVRYVPVPALLPIFVLSSGIGETPKFLVLFFGTFFQLVLLILDDADNVSPAYFDLARTFGARDLEMALHVLVPSLLPQIYDRLRITLGWCWTYLVIAELVAVQRGVGHVIKEAQRFNAAPDLFVCCFVLGFVGLATDLGAKALYGRLFPWAVKSGRQGRT